MRLPDGQLALVIADTEGSTAALRAMGSEQYADALAQQRRIFDETAAAFGGVAEASEGDAALFAFADPADALVACAEVQRRIAAAEWPASWHWRVRMGVQIGEALTVGDVYVGIGIHRAARVSAAARGDQVIVTREAAQAAGPLTDGLSLRSLGCYRLRDHDGPVELLIVDDMARQVEDRPLKALPAEGHGLPLPRTTLIGRRSELTEVAKLVIGNRLVTVVGPGGAGKSRLAVEAATELLADFPDGAWWVDLAPVRDDTAVPRAIAAGLALEPDSERPVDEQVLDALVGRKLIVVFDNCEHLIDGVAAFVDRILGTASHVHVLCTSRAPLRLGDEAMYRLPPLAAPDPDSDVDLDEILTSDAVRLLRERVGQQGIELALDHRSGPLAARLCARLDGLPLAIELAAPRVASTGLAAVLARVEAGRDPGGFSRSGSERHRSLTTMLEWSWELLGDMERTVFQRLAVLPGGATAEAAVAVVGDEFDSFDVLDSMEALAEQSLMVGVEGADGRTRYRHLETIRAFALERLEGLGEERETMERAGRWLHHRLVDLLEGPDLSAAVRAAAPDLENYRAGWRWARHHDVELFTRFAAAGGALLHELGLVEARTLLEDALAHADKCTGRTHARLLTWAAAAAQAAVDEAAAVSFNEQILALDGVSPQDQSIAWNRLAEMALWSYDGRRGLEFGEKALAMAEYAEAWSDAAAACASVAAAAAINGDYDRAASFVERADSHADRDGGLRARGHALAARGAFAELTGDIAQSRSVALALLANARQQGMTGAAFHPALSLGDLALTAGDLTEAQAYFDEMMSAARKLGRPHGLVVAHGMLGEIAIARGDLTLAEVHAGRVEALVRDIGDPSLEGLRLVTQVSLAIARGDVPALPALADALLEHCDALGMLGHGIAGQALASSDHLERARQELTLAIDAATPVNRRELASFLLARAEVGQRLGEPRAATAPDAAQALAIVIDLGAKLVGADALDAAARVVAPDQPAEAARMLAAADALRSRQGAGVPIHELERRAALIGSLGMGLPSVPADITIEAAATDALRVLEVAEG